VGLFKVPGVLLSVVLLESVMTCLKLFYEYGRLPETNSNPLGPPEGKRCGISELAMAAVYDVSKVSGADAGCTRSGLFLSPMPLRS